MDEACEKTNNSINSTCKIQSTPNIGSANTQ